MWGRGLSRCDEGGSSPFISRLRAISLNLPKVGNLPPSGLGGVGWSGPLYRGMGGFWIDIWVGSALMYGWVLR
eukprot:scaffold30744_cov84-Isochrysis_galbana.AAC.2